MQIMLEANINQNREQTLKIVRKIFKKYPELVKKIKIKWDYRT